MVFLADACRHCVAFHDWVAVGSLAVGAVQAVALVWGLGVELAVDVAA